MAIAICVVPRPLGHARALRRFRPAAFAPHMGHMVLQLVQLSMFGVITPTHSPVGGGSAPPPTPAAGLSGPRGPAGRRPLQTQVHVRQLRPRHLVLAEVRNVLHSPATKTRVRVQTPSAN
jgi:hypothetical protein